jgi:hypothetical protein
MAEETNELTNYENGVASENSVMEETPEEVGHLKAQIEETRQHMGETIDAIQEKLSFSNISEQVSDQVSSVIETAKHAVYKETIGKMVNYMKNKGNEISGTSVVKMVKENPVPFMLIAAGAGLLAYNGFARKSGSSTTRNTIEGNDNRDIGEGRSSTSFLSSAQEKVGDLAAGISGAAGSAIEGVSSAAVGTYTGIANTASNAYTGVNELARAAYDKAGEYGNLAHEKYDHHIQENPLAVGAVALAVGAAVGLAIPSTRYEGELMGEASQNLLQKAQDSAGNLVDKVKQVASEAGETLKSEVGSKEAIH